MDTESGLVCAYAVTGEGATTRLDWAGVKAWKPGDGYLWVHLDYAVADAFDWLVRSDIDDITIDGLLARDPRPRSLPVGDDALMVIIRGVNLNAGADPEDMVSLRMHVTKNRVVTLRHRKFQALRFLRDAAEKDKAPLSTGDFVVDITDRILDKIARVVDKLDDDVDEIEDEVLSAEDYKLRQRVARFRRAAIAFRRHIAPQREVMSRLQNERVSWLDERDRAKLRESADRLTRIIEELDSAKERAMVTSEELSSRLGELMNKRLYMLSIVAAIFLPLGFVTGALGVNLGGIPGTTWPWGFGVMCLAMVGLGAIQIWIFHKRGWF